MLSWKTEMMFMDNNNNNNNCYYDDNSNRVVKEYRWLKIAPST